MFALGAILFRLLTGRPPFAGETRVETIRLTVEGKAPPASKYVAGVPRALEAIVAGCLRRRPADRYPSAAALAEDLGRFLDGRRAARRPLRGLARAAAALAVAAVLAVSSPRPRVDPRPAAAAPPAPAPAPAADDARVKDRVHKAARLIEGLLRTFATMNGREFAAIAEASEDALAEARAASSRLAADPDFRRDYSALAGGMARLESGRRNGVAACDLFVEAADLAGPVGGAPWTTDARMRRSIFLAESASRQIEMRRYDRATAALEDAREVLRPVLATADAADLDREARFLMATIQVEEGPTAEGWRALAALREEVRAALRERPLVQRLWHILGDVCRKEGRRDEFVEACRRLRALPATDGEFGEMTADRLAAALIEQARAARDPSARRSALDEAEILVRDRQAHLDRIRDARGEEFAVMDEVNWLATLARHLEAERERDGAEIAGDRFAGRLAAALAAEASDGRPPVDGGRLASLREALAAEYSWITRPGAFDPPPPDAVRGGIPPGLGSRDFERGLALLERGEGAPARLQLASGLAAAAARHRVDQGDWRRAAELCEQARSLIDATPAVGDPAERLLVLNESWSQTIKALWDHAERPRTREALHRAIEVAGRLFELRPGEDYPRLAYDKALARLAHFEREGGDFDAAAAVMASRRPLWPPGSSRAVVVEDALQAIEDERKSAAPRGGTLAEARPPSPRGETAAR